jgi:PAS domain S-box-containing protein
MTGSRGSTDYTQLLLDATPDAVFITTPEGKVLHWNAEAERVFGYSGAEAAGKPVEELIVPPGQQEPEHLLRRDALERGTATAEMARRRKDGALLYAVVSERAVYDGEGLPVFLVASSKDVTQLKVLRDAKLLESKFRDLLESTPDAIIIANQTGRIVLANSQAGSLFGYERAELLGEVVELLLPSRYSGHVSHRSGFFAQPRTRRMGAGLELYGLRKNGEEFPVEISLSPLQTDEGTLVMSAIRDISERRRADQKFRGLLESAPDAMVIASRSGEIVLVNAQTERLFGYPREELLGRKVETLIPERFHTVHAPHRTAFFQQPRARAMGADLQLHGRRRDGSEFPVEISLSPIETEEGTLVSSAIRDITDRRRIERALQEKNAELERANHAKDRFLASMSHELRTPLNGIIGFTEFLVDGKPGPLNDKQREYLGDVLQSGRHLLHLINDMLDLVKVQAGKVELSPEPFSLSAAIGEVCVGVLPIAKAKSIEVDVDVAPGLDAVTLDRQRFKQILYNLLSNALKFTDPGGHVRIEATSAGEARFRVSVTDDGIGIRAEDIGRLFTEFEQLDTGTARRFGGTGLGLALTRNLVNIQGGEIDVESEFGKGSSFIVTLPLTPAGVLA